MKKAIIFTATILSLAIINWMISTLFNFNFVDVSIPLSVVSVGFAHSFTDGTSPFMRQSDMETRGETCIRMPLMKKAVRTSFIFFGSLAYFMLALVMTFFFYKEYFVG